MAGEKEVSERIEELRGYERECYQTAYYLLGREDDAVLATERTLLELAGDSSFWSASREARREQARRRTVMESLKLKRTSMPDMVLQKSAYIC